MRLLAKKYSKHYLSAAAAKYVFDDAPDNELRQFTKDLIKAVGPLNETYIKIQFDTEDWEDMLAEAAA